MAPTCLAILCIAWAASPAAAQSIENLVLSRMGVSEILRYLDASDHNKGLSEEQVAAKYIIGEIRPDVPIPARVYLEWKALPPSEQRQLKVIWFREHYRQIDVEDVNKYVNVDYLKARAKDEFRDNPLERAPKEAKAEKKPEPKPSKVKKKLKASRTWTAVTDTALADLKRRILAKKKAETGAVAAQKPKPAVAKPARIAKSDTAAPSAKSESPLKSIQWYGVPTKMKNE